MDVIVRSARVRDADAVAAIHARSWRWAYRRLLSSHFLSRLDPRALAPRWRRTIARDLGPQRVAVAEIGGEVRGFVAYGMLLDPSWLGHAGEIGWLYVDPPFVGGGVGRLLLDHAIADLESDGHLWLRVRVLEDNARARAFYERAGLRLDGERRVELVGGTPIAVVCYARALSPVVDWAELFARARS